MTTQEWIDRIDRIMACIDGTPPDFTVPMEIINGIHGQTTSETRQFLNALCRGGQNYLEIGTYHGASLLTAAYHNSGQFIGMDNFSIFPEGGRCKEDLLHNIETHGTGNVRFLEMDEAEAIYYIDREFVDVFFYDGHHGAENTTDAIIRYLPALKDVAVLLVDDYDWGPPCIGVHHALREFPRMGWRVAKSWEHTCHVPPVNSHNGLYIGVLERQ